MYCSGGEDIDNKWFIFKMIYLRNKMILENEKYYEENKVKEWKKK